MELLECRHLLATGLVINELMASNESTLETWVRSSVDDVFPNGTSISPDWCELKNLGDQPVDLTGAYLTDDRRNQKKWQVPGGTGLAAQEFLTIFASGLDVSHTELD